MGEWNEYEYGIVLLADMQMAIQGDRGVQNFVDSFISIYLEMTGKILEIMLLFVGKRTVIAQSV
jgi:hypothetical protein